MKSCYTLKAANQNAALRRYQNGHIEINTTNLKKPEKKNTKKFKKHKIALGK